MNGYIKFYDEAPIWLRIILSIVCIPGFLYRLFKVIIDKAEDTSKLVYLILNVIPIIGTVIVIIDIVWCALKRALPLCFADWSNPTSLGEPAADAKAEETPKADE